MAYTYNQRRARSPRRSSDRNFLISIIMMFALVFVLGYSIGYYVAAEKAATMILNSEKEKNNVRRTY